MARKVNLSGSNGTKTSVDDQMSRLSNIHDDQVLETAYGFAWGNANVERTASHKRHRVITIKTPKHRLEVRVTPSGLIRIDNGAQDNG